jgi:hypothetical protein
MSVSHSAQVFDLEQQLVLSLCENIGTPRALSVAIQIRYGAWQEILNSKIDWRNYDDRGKFADDYLVTAILQKNPRLPTGIDRAKVAIDKFLAAEQQCAETNIRLLTYSETGIGPDPFVHRVIHYAREFIRTCLGQLSRADLAFCEENMAFGPGATTSVSGVVTQGKKYSPRVLDTTPRLVDFGLFASPIGWRKSIEGFAVRRSSKLTTVPKNAKTDRAICIEPDLNIFVQKGIGALIRDKLLRLGLDLTTQENNRALAQKASELDLCTIDLSAASDTVSQQVVWLLLPERWAELLHFARVDFTSLNGEEIALEKWSSMGNGYTFELETLIFWSILKGVQQLTNSDGPVIAFGDDLVCPESDFDLVRRTLEFLGFNVNVEKTFGKGRFHESCGTDWFDGEPVRPVFLRSEHHDFPTICYIYANGLRRWAFHRNSGLSCDRRVLPAWLRCFRAVKPEDRHQIPQGFGDVGVEADFDRAVPRTPSRGSERRSGGRRLGDKPWRDSLDGVHPYGWSGYEFSYRHIASRRVTVSEIGSLTAFLNRSSGEWTLGKESLRGHYRPAVTRKGHVHTWPHLGPWA